MNIRIKTQMGMIALLSFSAMTACQPSQELPLNNEAVQTSAVTFESVSYSGFSPAMEGQTLESDEFFNPILPGFYPDPSITQTEDKYYLVNSTFSFFPGIPVFESEDLVNWTQIGNVIDRPDMLDFSGLGLSRGVFAPTIEYEDGLFYVLNTCVDCGGNFLVTAENPAGPWSDPVWLPHVGGIDPSIFFDEGRAYIINNDAPEGEPRYEGHRAVWIREVDPQTYEPISEPNVIIDGGVDPSTNPIWIEGPHIYKQKGWYYLSAAEGGTSVNHSQVILRSKQVTGPYTPFSGNPVLTQRDLPADRPYPITSTGHADYVQDAAGNWWAAFLAVQPYRDNYYNTGRETFLLPVDWSGEWPIILEAGKDVPRVLTRPVFDTNNPAPETAARLDWTESFDAPPGPQWLSIRGELADNLSVDGGDLQLTPGQIAIGDMGIPSFIGARQQHSHADMQVSVIPDTLGPNVEAGLVILQRDEYFYALTAASTGANDLSLKLIKRAGAARETVAQQTISISDPAQPLDLKVSAMGESYAFEYRADGGEWTLLAGEQDGTVLSTESAGGFVGAVFGPYAYEKTP